MGTLADVEVALRPLLILGTGLLAVELHDLVSEIPGWYVAGFVANLERERCPSSLLERPIHWIDDISIFASTHHALCGISTTQRTSFQAQAEAHGLTFATLVHPSARVSRTSALGAGTFVSPGVIIASNTKLGRHVFVNRGVLIGHHTVIGNFVTIQPGANVAGACHVGDGTYIGMGAVILDRIRIGADSVVGAGSVVTKDVPDHVQVVGVPARIVKEISKGK